jgi:hypothetical protein
MTFLLKKIICRVFPPFFTFRKFKFFQIIIMNFLLSFRDVVNNLLTPFFKVLLVQYFTYVNNFPILNIGK